MATLKEVFTNIANAIREKNGSTNTITPSEMPGLISSIETGINTSDATATAADILIGKTAYANAEKLIGTLKPGVVLNTTTYIDKPDIVSVIGEDPYLTFYLPEIKSTSTIVNFTMQMHCNYNDFSQTWTIMLPTEKGAKNANVMIAQTQGIVNVTTTYLYCTIGDNYMNIPLPSIIEVPDYLSINSIIFCRLVWYDE